MKFCMECGQKSPPAAKFCPGCGNALSLNNEARVKDVEDAPDISDNEIKDITLPDGCVTISGGASQPLTIKEVIASAPETPQPESVNTPVTGPSVSCFCSCFGGGAVVTSGMNLVGAAHPQ